MPSRADIHVDRCDTYSAADVVSRSIQIVPSRSIPEKTVFLQTHSEQRRKRPWFKSRSQTKDFVHYFGQLFFARLPVFITGSPHAIITSSREFHPCNSASRIVFR